TSGFAPDFVSLVIELRNSASSNNSSSGGRKIVFFRFGQTRSARVIASKTFTTSPSLALLKISLHSTAFGLLPCRADKFFSHRRLRGADFFFSHARHCFGSGESKSRA